MPGSQKARLKRDPGNGLIEYLKGTRDGAFPADRLADSTISKMSARFGIAGSLIFLLVFLGAGVFPVVAICFAGITGYSISLVLDYRGWNRVSRLWTGTVFLSEVGAITWILSIQSGFDLFILTGLPMSQVLFGRNERPLKILAIALCIIMFVPSGLGLCDMPRLPIDQYWLKLSSLFAAISIFSGFAIVLQKFAALIRQGETEQREMATTDELTGLRNRRHVLAQADDMVKIASRYGRNLSVIIMDIDHFKVVNDTFGHIAGDKVLRDISNALSRCTRKADIIGRYGGEEFVMILPETDVEQATVVAEHVRQEVAALAFEFDGNKAGATLSAGISAFCPKEGVDFNKILSRADTALYAAKADGRNCVKVWKHLEEGQASPCPPS
jgi:diguanylate cyclase (GGDEF)-like protein